jgi:hypothetical protein
MEPTTAMNAAAAETAAPAGPSIADTVAEAVSRLNLASPHSLAGVYFQEIVALTCLLAGGFLVLFGWKHHRYVLAVLGMLVGGWTGLMIKARFAPMGVIPPLPYLALCGAIGGFLAITLRRFVGILLGGFTSACIAVVILPAFLRPDGSDMTSALCITFLVGGGLGALHPRFFYIFNTSLIGASFFTYGLYAYLHRAAAIPGTRAGVILLQLGLFLPLLVAGMVYQYWTAPPEEETDLQPVRKPKAKTEAEEKPEPAGAKA